MVKPYCYASSIKIPGLISPALTSTQESGHFCLGCISVQVHAVIKCLAGAWEDVKSHYLVEANLHAC